ncbi:MAG: hypothetical protein ABFD54_15760 [Armatimonadota bacterium]|nr:porin family protein [bacterium]
MRNSLFIIFTALLLTILLGTTAFAQYESNDRSPIGIRVGFFMPSGSALSDINGIYIGPMLNYQTKFDNMDRPSLTVSVGWFGDETNYKRASLIPLTANYIKHFGTNPNRSPYIGGGVGLYYTSYRPGSSYYYDTYKDFNLGLNMVAGIELGATIFAEASYSMVPKISAGSEDIDFSGLCISVGSRMAY